jgi:hypothetical protein
MKLKLDVDCTPEEARAFLGLPDLRPIQATLSAEMERRMREALNAWSPDAALRQWFSLLPPGADDWRKMMETFMKGAGGGPEKK